ncbi:MAG: hypothetical protein LBM04_07150, partial [Opitutaceae bacterium]|nr:hypothetical protein [Opitutaceae bacterium]
MEKLLLAHIRFIEQQLAALEAPAKNAAPSNAKPASPAAPPHAASPANATVNATNGNAANANANAANATNNNAANANAAANATDAAAANIAATANAANIADTANAATAARHEQLRSLLAYHLAQTQAFQHERLIHLLVTFFFALLLIGAIIGALLWPVWQLLAVTLILAVTEILY